MLLYDDGLVRMKIGLAFEAPQVSRNEAALPSPSYKDLRRKQKQAKAGQTQLKLVEIRQQFKSRYRPSQKTAGVTNRGENA